MGFNVGQALGGGGGGTGGAVLGSTLGSIALGGPAGMAIGAAMGGGPSFLGKVFGTGEDPGWLGVGKFNPQGYQVDESAFRDHGILDQRRESFGKALYNSTTRNAPMVGAATIQRGDSDQMRQRQLSLAQALEDQANGRGPSVAQTQLKQSTDRNLAQAIAMQASARGGSGGGLALRQIQQQRSDVGQQAAQQAAILRAQEIQAARGQLGDVLANTRGQDASYALNQAQLDQAAGTANQAARMQQAGLNDQMERFYQQGMAGMDLQQMQQLQELEKIKAAQNAALEQARASSYQNASQARGNFVGGLGQGLSAFAMSDEDLKTDIEDGEDPLKKFLKAFSMTPKEEKREGAGYGLGKLSGAMLSKMKSSPKEANPAGIDASMGMDAGMVMAYKGGLVCDGKTRKMAEGGIIPGEAKVDGDSPENDVVPILASPGEAIIPRSVMKDEKKLKEFVEALKAHQYTYKDKKHGAGTYISPMAQELEKTELGKSMVVETPDGKAVDYARAGGVMLATAAMLNNRLDSLEDAFKKRAKK